ncbi:VPS10 domain-containing receptor SorCS2 [Varanus komodoensis]|nr:VPS10 domain-containing receptor SorCS2 [Varanus komodoensis]
MLIFHPKQEDKLLAYTKEGQLHASIDLGIKWTLLQERVSKDHIFWAVDGVDGDPDVVHMEIQDPDGDVYYMACPLQNCSDKALQSPFAGSIDKNSLTVQDDYIFLQTSSANQTKYYVSYLRNAFVQMKLPKYALPKDLQIISTDESQVFVAIQEWYQTDTYNLYQSDPQGVSYSIVLENVRSTKQPEENVLIDILEVRGVKGVFLANQKVDGKVATLITFNKGRSWASLTPPATDMNGKPTDCKMPDCHLHLHLRWPDNPYVSGMVHTKDTAPGLIMGAGNLGAQLVEYKEEMYITSDCGKTWRQVFEEEHHILYLDHGGVIVAIKDTSIPLKILKAAVNRRFLSRFSVDEGQTWSTHNFTSTSVFVDGLLSEPGDETLVMTVFGHISYRSDWELVKVDFRPSFSRECTDEDYESWDLTNLQRAQGSLHHSPPPSYPHNNNPVSDYGFERSTKSESDTCFAEFWFNPDAPPEDCILGQSYRSSTGYRRVISNVCMGGVDLQQNVSQHLCPLTAPKGLQILIKGGSPAVRPGEDVTFLVKQERGDILNTKYQVDLGDGVKATYMNLTLTGEHIQHRYANPGVYRVSVVAENAAGRDEAVVIVQVHPPLQALHLEVLPVVSRNQEVNLTALIMPRNPNFTLLYWWIGNNLQPLLSLDNFLVTSFAEEGKVRVTVQASCGNSMLQDSKIIQVLDHFQVLSLKFSEYLDLYNPSIPAWREDIGHVVTQRIAKETSIPEEYLVTVVKPGRPTTADLHVLLPTSHPKKKRAVSADKRIAAIKQSLNAHNISFFMRGGRWVLVTLDSSNSGCAAKCDAHARDGISHLASLIADSQRTGGGGGYWTMVVLFLFSLVAAGALIFYKFKRQATLQVLRARPYPWCIPSHEARLLQTGGLQKQGSILKLPGRNVYAQMQNEKEQEMTSPVNHREDTQNIIQGEEFIDDDLECQTLGNARGNLSGVVLSINSRETHSYS